MSQSTVELLKVVGPIVAAMLAGLGWYMKRRLFDLPARDREFVVGVVKEGLQFLKELETQLTATEWFDDEFPNAKTASGDLILRHALVDEAAKTYERLLLEAQARLPPRIVKALSLPIHRWSTTRLLQRAHDNCYSEGRNLGKKMWFQAFRKQVLDDLEYHRKLLSKISGRY